MQGTTKKGVFGGDYLFVRRKRRAGVRYVFSSYQVTAEEYFSHIRYRWSHLVKQVLHLKFYWDVEIVR